ncbi:hypothetical protein [Paenibacillus typhae]|uniref:Uncharacterized protein n=1 Tax=Paenibacillus typhae TaxID=1174501 RepID=A0A1G9AZM3_9BACL|nr:hypothetical protein [Paenibacillus typhae]SDK32766.1 hypothetical protein SAMN05216192_13841 [Paenibacillus typhae]
MDNSDIVFVVVAINNTKNLTQEVDGYPEGHTLTSVKVNKVLKNTGNVEIGEYFEVAEPYFIWDKGIVPGKQKITYDGYTDLQGDASYVLFLKWGRKYQRLLDTEKI